MTDEHSFATAYAALNSAQKQAVDAIDGPLLVIAGPGTGKTQLLSARVANILSKTDTAPQNILCLTFTENGALNMRERLTSFIGQAAYDVTIGTYHSFGADILRRFPQYFTELRLQNPVDELGKHQIVSTIVERMSYQNPLKQTAHHLGDLIGTISEVKRALLTATDLQAIAAENSLFIEKASQYTGDLLRDFSLRMPTKFSVAETAFAHLLTQLQALVPTKPVSTKYDSLAAIAVADLQTAFDEAAESGKAKPLTAWKNKWLAKDANNQFIFNGTLENNRIRALADVFEQYQMALADRGLYDFDDMIIRAIEALQAHDDLKFTLQEQYLYLLLDEFQDTNAAQLQLVALLTDNPVSNGRPNVMAVGDDDQAIYAFQGAQYSNMLDFYHLYRDVRIINLQENYRSHSDVIETAGRVRDQIQSRLEDNFPDTTKQLVAASHQLPKNASIERMELVSSLAQYDWIALQIEQLIAQGTRPHEIAVLAPRHRQLEPLVAYLNARNIPVRYEKRENILQAPVVSQLITMCRLVLALAQNDSVTANALWPEVISFDFWNISTTAIWKLSWANQDSKNHTDWSKAMLEDGATFRTPALLFLTLAHKVHTETLETILDYLIGSAVLDTKEADYPQVVSPLRDYYMSATMQVQQPEILYETLSHLTVLRAKLRDYQKSNDDVLMLADFIRFVNDYEAAETPILNTSPYNQQADAVQLMTVFKAKGLEFEHVFLPSVHDNVWGSSSYGSSNKITLPANLAPIRHAGANEDERLRLLFVAITRAKFGLHLSSYRADFTGKPTKRLKYLDEQEQPDGSFKTRILPDADQVVRTDSHDAPPIELFQLNWQHRHIGATQQPELKELLMDRLVNYQLSPTHLNTFTDLEYGGPERFFFNTILRFPQAPTISGQFGNAIHETLEWVQHRVSETGSIPPTEKVVAQFGQYMAAQKLLPEQLALETERGTHALTSFMKNYSGHFHATDRAEVNFRNENVFVGAAHLAGKIDRMEIDREHKTITVVDYKTGKSHHKWESTPKLHKYRQQLYCYKILIEKSRSFAGYTVTKGYLAFVEPDVDGQTNLLGLDFDDEEVKRTTSLLQAMWQCVQHLNLPDISPYDATLKGIKQFEQDLLDGNI